ncbi:MAG: HD domain-containing phosphohydrolase, partial [Betaproteobacteria bacterium]
RQALEEYLDDLRDLAPKIEQDVARLRNAPDDPAVIGDLFRTLHNIKGDAALCKVEMGVTISHPLETLLMRVRSGELRFTGLLGEIILLTIDRLELAVEALVAGRPLAHLQLVKLVEGLEQLGRVRQDRMDAVIGNAIESVTGFRPVTGTAAQAGRTVRSAIPRAQDEVAADLRFFRSLAQQLESRSPHFRGRTVRTLRLALATNQAAGKPVDPVQLEAAVYMHDVGMMLLPEAAWLKTGRLSESDKKALRTHPGYGAGLLERMEDWKPAAEMVAQHHEMPDGAGYPAGLTAERICPGAKILAMVDAFEAVMLKHTHRGQSRSMLRAIAEVNACNNQFAAEWITPFNAVIRQMIEA